MLNIMFEVVIKCQNVHIFLLLFNYIRFSSHYEEQYGFCVVVLSPLSASWYSLGHWNIEMGNVTSCVTSVWNKAVQKCA